MTYDQIIAKTIHAAMRARNEGLTKTSDALLDLVELLKASAAEYSL